jgi:hypothetical protein
MVDLRLLILSVPIALILAAAIGLRFRFPFWLIILCDVLVLMMAGYLLYVGVRRSCLIDQSECIGATATAYIVSGFLFMVVAAQLVVIRTWPRKNESTS